MTTTAVSSPKGSSSGIARNAARVATGKTSFAVPRVSDIWRAPLTDLPVRDELIRQYVPLSREMELLEVGPGNGFPAFRMMRAVARLTLLEVSPASSAKLRRLFEGVPNVNVLHADICRPGAGEEYACGFDAVVAIEVFEMLADPASALRNMAAMLRPGGSLYMQFPNYKNSEWPTSYATREALERDLRAAGFADWKFYTLRLTPWSHLLFHCLHEAPLLWYRRRKQAQRGSQFSLTYDETWAFHHASRFESWKIPIHLYWAAIMLAMRLGGAVFRRVECGEEIMSRNLFVQASKASKDEKE